MNMNGIDVSSYQGNINIRNVSADFVIVKVTEGTTYVNPYWQRQANDTIISNKKLGLYHFIDGHNAIQQANFFVSEIGAYLGKVILFLDFEPTIVGSSTVDDCYNWLLEVERLTGNKPMIYINSSINQTYNWKKVVMNDNGLWIANYPSDNYIGYQNIDYSSSLYYWQYPAIYQYSSHGRLNGYNGNLDLNIFYGNQNQWDKYCKIDKSKINQPLSETSAGNSWVDNLGVIWIREAGIFISESDKINLRAGATVNSNIIGTIYRGQKVVYNAKCADGGYIWVRQPRADGTFGYLAVGSANNKGENINPYGRFE